MSEPIRIQRKRTKGWRMPENTVYVGRPSQWGNPFKVGKGYRIYNRADGHRDVLIEDAEFAVRLFREEFRWPAIAGPRMKRELRGKNLACWCPLDQPCHADVLLEWANS